MFNLLKNRKPQLQNHGHILYNVGIYIYVESAEAPQYSLAKPGWLEMRAGFSIVDEFSVV